jgi:hypothetical protein
MVTAQQPDGAGAPSPADVVAVARGVRATMVHAAAQLVLGVGAFDGGDVDTAAVYCRAAHDAMAAVRS